MWLGILASLLSACHDHNQKKVDMASATDSVTDNVEVKTISSNDVWK